MTVLREGAMLHADHRPPEERPKGLGDHRLDGAVDEGLGVVGAEPNLVRVSLRAYPFVSVQPPMRTHCPALLQR